MCVCVCVCVRAQCDLRIKVKLVFLFNLKLHYTGYLYEANLNPYRYPVSENTTVLAKSDFPRDEHLVI